MKIIVGLGNPLLKYKFTRHNLGFMALDRIAEENGIEIKKRKFNSIVGEGSVSGREVVLAKPITYMNRSGESVARFIEWYKIPLTELMVICDDINLKVGTIRIRRKGSFGGHRGMESIIDSLGTELFPRTRIGISPSNAESLNRDLSSYVLKPFTKKEEGIIHSVIDKACEACLLWINEGIDAAMNRFND